MTVWHHLYDMGGIILSDLRDKLYLAIRLGQGGKLYNIFPHVNTLILLILKSISMLFYVEVNSFLI